MRGRLFSAQGTRIVSSVDSINVASCIVVAVRDGRIIAVVPMSVFHIMPTRRNPTGKQVYLFDFYVLSKFRRRPIATDILHRLKDEARLISV